MHIDPYLFTVTSIIFFLLLSSLILKKLKQPYIVAYLLAGIAIGPFGLKVVNDEKLVEHIGSFGVVLLLFFVGLEVSIKDIVKNWKISFLGTVLQILLSILLVYAFGSFFDWPFKRSLLLGFVISLSSTAVAVQFLKEKGLLEKQVGKDVLGILIMQDLALIPILIILASFSPVQSGDHPGLGLQILGALILVGALFFATKYGRENFRGLSTIKRDKETQVLAALTFALGLSLVSGLFGLSTALGAFVAGAIIRSFHQIHWVHESLESFRVVFLAMFFASIGLLVDIPFFISNWKIVLGFVLLALVTNTLINAFTLKALGRRWSESFFSAAILSQIGEFSFVLAAIGLNLDIINKFSYDMTILTIFLTMILTPMWIKSSRMFFLRGKNEF